jgi:hypothetical protein
MGYEWMDAWIDGMIDDRMDGQAWIDDLIHIQTWIDRQTDKHITCLLDAVLAGSCLKTVEWEHG